MVCLPRLTTFMLPDKRLCRSKYVSVKRENLGSRVRVGSRVSKVSVSTRIRIRVRVRVSYQGLRCRPKHVPVQRESLGASVRGKVRVCFADRSISL